MKTNRGDFNQVYTMFIVGIIGLLIVLKIILSIA